VDVGIDVIGGAQLSAGEQRAGVRQYDRVLVDRTPYIRMAFELYATGKHGFHTLHTALTDAGLRTRPTRKRPPGR
jgi:hypothetical protein